MRKNINEIWMEAFREKFPDYPIINYLVDDFSSCIYLLDDNKELRITVNKNMYSISTALERINDSHIAKIYECFETKLPDQSGDKQNVFCIISEHLRRDFAPKPIIQSGINLFRNLWCEYLSLSNSALNNPYVDIENAYADNNSMGKRFVTDGIKLTDTSLVVKDIAFALNQAYGKIKLLYPNAILYPNTDNIGLSENNVVKICNIGHGFTFLDNNYYKVDNAPSSITITYNPHCDTDYVQNFIKDNRMLIPLWIEIEGDEALVLGQIDTGATASGFTENFHKRASLVNRGETTVCGISGIVNSIRTECKVRFPNDHIETLYGGTYKASDEVDILIGMDLLSRCKFYSEPYKCGFKYKLTFL